MGISALFTNIDVNCISHSDGAIKIMRELFLCLLQAFSELNCDLLREGLGKKEDRKDFSTMDRRVGSKEFCQPKGSVKAQFQAHFKACF